MPRSHTCLPNTTYAYCSQTLTAHAASVLHPRSYQSCNISCFSPSSILDSRFSILDSRSSLLDSRFSILDSRFSILDPRFSILDSRFSILDSRSSILDSRFSSSGVEKPKVSQTQSSSFTPGTLSEILSQMSSVLKSPLLV